MTRAGLSKIRRDQRDGGQNWPFGTAVIEGQTGGKQETEGRHLGYWGQVGGLRVSGRAWLVYRTTQKGGLECESTGSPLQVHWKSTKELPNEGNLWNVFCWGTDFIVRSTRTVVPEYY